MESDETDSEEPQVTALSREVKRLKSAAMGIIDSRERVPHPLFWSAFQIQIAEIKKLKEKDRVRRNRLYYGEQAAESEDSTRE